MSAKATGAAPNGDANGNAKNRSHNDGSSGRAFTDEQKAAVIRVRKCGPTAFYDILGLESEKTTVDDAGIKRAYRKLSLLTHPDKNGYPGSDEAFKLVSRAFQILSDADKKKQFDQFGVDPDNRFASSSSGASPFAGFQRSPSGMRGAGGNMFEEEISPEELFRQFFGGGLGGGFGGPFGGGLFDAGPGFVFNMGGGPGVRIHQFGGNRPRRRPPGTHPGDPNAQARQQQGASSVLSSLLPLFLFLVLPLLSSLFSSSSSSRAPRVPEFNIDVPKPPHLTLHHTSRRYQIPYYVNPSDVAAYTAKDWQKFDTGVETQTWNRLEHECHREQQKRNLLLQQAQGWLFIDQEKERAAYNLPMPSCYRLNDLEKKARGWF